MYLQRKMNDVKRNYNGLYRVETNITKKKKKQRKTKIERARGEARKQEGGEADGVEDWFGWC